MLEATRCTVAGFLTPFWGSPAKTLSPVLTWSIGLLEPSGPRCRL